MSQYATVAATSPRQEQLDAKPDGTPEQRVGALALTLLPGALVVYFSFTAGGFFPGSVGFGALLVSQILLLRILIAERPFAGMTRLHRAAVIAFAAYTAWTLASGLWSHAVGRAFVEFDRALLYLLLLILAGCLPRHPERTRLMLRGLAAGSLFVCGVSLISRVLPHVWPTSAGFANNRLSYPLTYWNALGILAALGILFLLGLTSNLDERKAVRALSAAGIPVLAATLLLTFSRGAIAALVFGVLVFVTFARTTAVVGAFVAAVPATGVAALVTYRANLLATLHPATPAALAQGRTVAAVVALSAIGAAAIRLLAEPVDRWLAHSMPRLPASSATRRVIGAAVIATAVAAVIIAGGPAWASKQFRLFIKSAPTQQADVRTRLTDPSGNNRTDDWRAALDAFSTQPLRGTGAGTYEFSWYRYRTLKGLRVVNAHSLYLETLSELGLVGLIALVATLAAIVVALVRRLPSSDRVLYATLLSAVLAWALHAGVDWDWQMPAVTAWVFAVGGVALAGTGKPLRRPLRWSVRVPAAAALLVLASIPTLLIVTEGHLQRATAAFASRKCSQADAEALSSIHTLDVLSKPYEVLGYCDITTRHFEAAVTTLRKAVQQEPGYWRHYLDLSVAQAYAGQDPRPEVRNALRLDPGESEIALMTPVLQTRSRAAWLRIAHRAYAQLSLATG